MIAPIRCALLAAALTACTGVDDTTILDRTGLTTSMAPSLTLTLPAKLAAKLTLTSPVTVSAWVATDGHLKFNRTTLAWGTSFAFSTDEKANITGVGAEYYVFKWQHGALFAGSGKSG